jgi:hypothetical protein
VNTLRIQAGQGGGYPGRFCAATFLCAIHSRYCVQEHFPNSEAAPSMVQLGRVVLAARFDDFGEWRHACHAFHRRFLAHLGKQPIASTPVAPYEAFYTALARDTDPAEAFRRLAEIPIPLHVWDGRQAWVEDAPPGAADDDLVRFPASDQGRSPWRDLPAHGRGIWRKHRGRWVRFMVARPMTAHNRQALWHLVRYLVLRASSSWDEYHLPVEYSTRVLNLGHPLAMANYRRLGQSLCSAVRPAHELAARALAGEGEHP